MWLKKFWIFLLFSIWPHGGIAQQSQHFKTAPKDQKVIEGSTALIECDVGNQGGRVQWVRDGFVLGFNRSIPGNPRYQMVGDGTDGVHHLRISNVTLEDDAPYQCQVGPADGHPPIRETAILTVLVPPTNVKVLAEGRSGPEIEVREESEITLECHVANAKPVAAIKWYRDETELKIDGRDDKMKESELDKRHDLVSTITVKLTASDNGAKYKCHAIHQALSGPMVSTVTISVLYPPGPPIITGYSDDENIKAGEERTLTCKSKGGNPLGRVVWYRNNSPLDSSDRRTRGESINEYRFVVGSKDNGATFTCEVKSKVLQKPLRKFVKLNVLFSADKVKVTGPPQAGIGENITINCLAENSNPAATISWIVDGEHQPRRPSSHQPSHGGGFDTHGSLTLVVPPVKKNVVFACHATNELLGKTDVESYVLSVLRPPEPPEIEGYHSAVGIPTGEETAITCISRGGNPPAQLQWFRNGQKISSIKQIKGERSSAKVFIRAESKDNGANYRCEASNAASHEPMSVDIVLTVYYPPKDVQLSLHPLRMKAGGQAELTCKAGPSNPRAQISWFRGSFKLNGHFENVQETPFKGKTVTSVLRLNLTSTDDLLNYTCEAKNTALQKVKSDSVTLRVSYPPVFLNPPAEVLDVRVGDSFVLNLTAKANPEPVSYHWRKEKKGSLRVDYNSRTGYSKSVISKDGPVFKIENASVADAAEYVFEATNELGMTETKFYLNVEYPPRVRLPLALVTVNAGEEALLECEVEGNPLKEEMMEWKRQDYDFLSRTQVSFGRRKAVLKIPSAKYNDTGHFSCYVDNGIGEPARANITLIVNTKPIITTPKQWKVSASQISYTGTLKCRAEGAPNITFAWLRDGHRVPVGALNGKFYQETRKTGLVTWVSTLEIRRVDSKDYGHYTCEVSNALGRSSSSVQFTAPTRPQPPLSLKVVNSSHDSVTLQWTPGFDGGLTQHFRIRYSPKSRNSFEFVDVYGPEASTFTVMGLNLNTEYFFSIMSRNSIGSSEYIGDFVRAWTLSYPAADKKDLLLNELLDSRGAFPQLIIITVAVIGSLIVIMNIALVICLIRRRRHSRKDDGSDESSSKSTTNTMYAPSSYNDTVVGETFSISEKSRESSYNQEDSVGEYDDDPQKGPHHVSSYLIDQIEPPPEYASQTPSSQPSSANYDPNEDDYAEVLRRNAYNHQLGKTTPRPPSRATHYSTSPESRGYLSYSYSPSPTNLPNGGVQYHGSATNPALNLCLQETVRSLSYPIPEDEEEASATFQSLGLDQELPPPMGLEQHSLPSSDHPSLTLDPHSITIDHPVIADANRNGDLRVLQHPQTSLSTFSPQPTNSYKNQELEGHLV